MMSLEDTKWALHELDSQREADARSRADGDQERYLDEFPRLALQVVNGMFERLPLTERWLPWWLAVVDITAAEAGRDLGVSQRAIGARAPSLTAEDLERAASLIGARLVRQHGRVLRRYASIGIDYLPAAGLAWRDTPEVVELAWRMLCREIARHDRVLALLSGQLPYDATPPEPDIIAPAAADLGPVSEAPAGPLPAVRRPLMRCPACAAQWRPRVPQPVKCPTCQYRFGWGA